MKFSVTYLSALLPDFPVFCVLEFLLFFAKWISR
jgi:hypothetical protein